MGKKKSSSSAAVSSAAITATRVPTQQFAVRENTTIKKLSQQKRNEINQLTDYLLKLGFDQTTGGLNELYAHYIEIQTNLERLQVIESELKPKSFNGKNRLATIDRFLEWARANGAQFDGVGIKPFPNYELGLVAADKDFAAGELFAVIPKRLLFTLENLSETVRNVMNQLPVLDTMLNVKLAFALVIERLNGDDSFWAPYLKMLPDRYPTVMYFTPNELAELKGTTAFSMALNQCKHIARQYAFIRKAIQNLPCRPGDTMMAILKERFTYDLYW